MGTEINKYTEFFDTHHVFSVDEFQKNCAISGYHTRNVLTKYIQNRYIRKIRNKLYTVLPEGSSDSFMSSPLLVAAKVADDSVLSYSSALAFYGLSRNTLFSFPYLSQKRGHKFQIGDATFQPCLPPKELFDAYFFCVTAQNLWHTPIRVVCKERLLVDSLDRLNLSGGWEEIAEAFQYENGLKWSVLLKYLEMLKSPATAGRVGFFLERFQKTMQVPEEILKRVETLKPKSAEYFYRSYRKGHLEKRWNLYVTDEMEAPKVTECVF